MRPPANVINRVTLFEATLINDGKLARIDILRKEANEFHVIEVKATSYDTQENEAAVADGRLNLFRTKRNQSIAAGWREYLEDVTFQTLVLREVFPQAKIRPFLLVPDKSKSTRIDRLYSLFRLHRRPVPGCRFERFEVEFTDDVEELRSEHFLTLVPVDAEVEMLAEEVSDATAEYIAIVRPRLRKVVTPLAVACRGCEYRAAEAGQHTSDCPHGNRRWNRFGRRHATQQRTGPSRAEANPGSGSVARLPTYARCSGPGVGSIEHARRVEPR
jgi:hypothetical protein